MKLVKSVLIMVLVLSLLTGMVPASVLAADDAAVDNSVASVDNGDLTIEGTNGFGNLLSEEIAEQQEAASEGASAGYTVTDLEIEGNVATVTYDSLEEATLVVALYTEDGLQMLLSGTTTVLPEETQATVVLRGTMPDYFLAAAYLLDNYDRSPLCPSYETSLYTKEMQELLDSTVEDYPADRVLNLDEDQTTNFAVYADSTIVIEPVEGMNIVTDVDNEKAVYVLENVDWQVESLYTGMVFVYPYSETDILIVKVADIMVNQGKATIFGDEVEPEEVFSHIKIEGSADHNDATIDDSVSDEGVTVVGNAPHPRMSGSATLDSKIRCELDIFKEGKRAIKGKMDVGFDLDFEYYLTWMYQSVRLRLDLDVELGAEIEVTANGKPVELKVFTMSYPICPGVTVACTPALVLESSVSGSVKVNFTTTLGFSFSNNWREVKFRNLCRSPRVTLVFELEGKVFIGLKLIPQVKVLGGVLANAKLEGLVGFELTGTLSTKTEEGVRHNCIGCLAGKLAFQIKVTPSVKFFKSDKLKFSIELANWKWDLFEFYACMQHMDQGLGKCPHQAYRVTITAVDAEDNVVADAIITVDGIELGRTNSNGVLVAYLEKGDYTLSTIANGTVLSKRLTVTQKTSVKLMTHVPEPPKEVDYNYVFPMHGDIIATGDCGENAYWALYESETLYIFGSGEVSRGGWEEYLYYTNTRIYIANGITGIANLTFDNDYIIAVRIPGSVRYIEYGAFYHCDNLGYVSLEEGLERIGSGAFSSCPFLKEISIPDSVQTIETAAFEDCPRLETVTFGKNCSASIADAMFLRCDSLKRLELGQPKSIGQEAFLDCTSLKAVSIPGSVKEIGLRAFSGCENLEYVGLNEGLEKIHDEAFAGCERLEGIIIPNSVLEIGEYAFGGCSWLHSITFRDDCKAILGSRAFADCTSLRELDISADGVSIGWATFSDCINLETVCLSVDVGPSMFSGCSQLDKVILREGVTNIGEWSFSECRTIKEIIIPNSVENIKQCAFENCNSLQSVQFKNDCEARIDRDAFRGCAYLTELNLGQKLKAIGYGAFAYTRLTAVIIPGNVETIEDCAFEGCAGLSSITFCGSAPESIYASAFRGVKATVYYDSQQETWTENNRQNYGGELTWVGSVTSNRATSIVEAIGNELTVSYATYTGKHETVVENMTAVQQASYTDLVPGAPYVLLVVKNADAADVTAVGNLLYIRQASAAEDGTLIFRYTLPVGVEHTYIMVCGPSNKDLADAVITFPEMTADGQAQAVAPVVTYQGTPLVEGLDYVVLGDVDFSDGGNYVCYIRGINRYTGVVRCSYSVATVNVTVRGTVESFSTTEPATVRLLKDGVEVYSTSAIGEYIIEDVATGTYTMQVSMPNHGTREYILMVGAEGAIQNVSLFLIGDVNADGKLNMKDWIRLYDHISEVSLLNGYALQCADVNADGKINMKDWVRVYDHLSETKPLW